VVTALVETATFQQQVQSIQADAALRAQQATTLASGHLNDPSVRVLAEEAVVKAAASRERALLGVYLAARALEYELNVSLPSIMSDLVPARRAKQIQSFASCLQGRFTDFRRAFGTPSVFTDEISLRRDVLGIRGPIRDAVTGETVSEADQFRRRLLVPSNLGPDGTVGLRFTTSLGASNGVLSSGVCNDQIRTIQVKLLGDGQGDDQARIKLRPAGSALERSCAAFRGGAGDVINQYDVEPRTVELEAGINTYPMAPPDAQLFGRSMAATEWYLAIPAGSAAPQNADLDLTRIEDVLLRVEHAAISLSDSPINFDPTCN
jgi:hypothetical protein